MKSIDKIRKILVPTDFSAGSDVALAHARMLAERDDAEVLVLHVTEEPFDYRGYGLSPETILEIQQKQREAIDTELKKTAEKLGVKKVSLHVREGSAPDQITAFAAENDVDLIVMGTHGRRGLRRLMLGSTAERVLRAAPCPVLTVRVSS